MKSKWLDYYQNIPIIYLLGIMFYPRCKLDYLFDCLDTYYKCLAIPFDVLGLIIDVKKLFYSLNEEYAKFYGHSLNINIEQDALSVQAPTSQVGKDYQILFQKTKRSRDSSSSST